MISRSHAAKLALAGAVLLLSACAPDAWKPDRGFDGWLAQLGVDCEGKQIGSARVDDLVRGRSNAAIAFTDQTSRLYEGRITPDSWATGVSAALNGWRTDAGIQCVLDRYAEYRANAPPSSAPPSR